MTEPYALEQSTQPSKASVWEDFIDIFYAPADVFRRRENGSWFIPMLVVTVLITGITLLTFNALEGAYRPLLDKAVEAAMQRPGVTPDAADTIRKVGAWQFKLFGLFFPILILLVALTTWFAGKFFGSKQSFRAAMVVVGYAQVARVVGAIAMGIEGLLMDPAKITSLSAITLGPVRFISRDAVSPFVYGVLLRLDVFTIWATVLIGIGVYVTGKVSKGSATAIALFVWMIGSLQGISAVMRGQL